jgi:hypothetical protein
VAKSRSIRVPGPPPAGLRLRGLGSSASSFELRLFLDAPSADASTPTNDNPSYLGSIHVYGHGQTSPAEMASPRAKTQRVTRDVEIDLPPSIARAARAAGIVLTLVAVDSHGFGLPADAISLDAVEPLD